MSEGNSKAREIDLGDDFGEVVVKVNHKIIKVGADGRVAVEAALAIGDLDDGGVYVGLSAEHGKPLHAALADLPDYKTYDGALAAAERLKSLHPTARVPTPWELDHNLFGNRNTGHLKGTFNTSGSLPVSLYRSSASTTMTARRSSGSTTASRSTSTGTVGFLCVWSGEPGKLNKRRKSR
jgi:hypothetical protein